MSNLQPSETGLESASVESGTGPAPLVSMFSNSSQPHIKMEPEEVQEAVVNAFNSQAFEAQPTWQASLEDRQGMPTRAHWNAIMETYLQNLHPSKREKALISEQMHKMIYRTLIEPDLARIGTPQFRFWCRKMFQVVDAKGALVITNGGRPIAVKEYIYDILCMCHEESGHSGRDKTCKILRDYYTWIPKELTANFVKACPTCIIKRSTESFMPRKVRSVLTDQSATMQVETCHNNQPISASAQYTVQHVNDFAKPFSQPQQSIHYHMSNLPHKLTGPGDCNYEQKITLESPLGPGLTTSCLYAVGGPFTENTCSAGYTLPPLAIRDDTDSNAKTESSGENHCLTLPPLLQFLSRSADSSEGAQGCPEEGPVNDKLSPASRRQRILQLEESLQLDPALLEESQSSNQPRLYPSLSSASIICLHGNNCTCSRDAKETDAETLSSGFRTADTTLCDDADQDQVLKTLRKEADFTVPHKNEIQLHSPIPIKVEHTNAILHLTQTIAPKDVITH